MELLYVYLVGFTSAVLVGFYQEGKNHLIDVKTDYVGRSILTGVLWPGFTVLLLIALPFWAAYSLGKWRAKR